MPKHLPVPATRAAAVATSAAALALMAVLPATPAAATPTGAATAPVVRIEPAKVRPLSRTNLLTVAPGRAATTAVATIAATAARVPLPTARSTSALSRAMSKIGSPYVWGAAGPNAFDCSGLVGWAYKQVGVSLPRSSNAMSKVGTPVAKSALRPGDLVFFYSPVSHVAMYIGGGKVVHASTSSEPVKISALDTMPFNSARRV